MEVLITSSKPPASQSGVKAINVENGTVKTLKCPYAVNSISLTPHKSYLMHIGTNKKDVYGSLFASSSLKWKCRLNSNITTPFVTSHCGSFVFAGNSEGSICTWNNLGELMSVIKAQYRAVTNIELISNGSFLMSAGEEGTCHLWNLADLCSGSDEDDVTALHSWSEHNLSVTSFLALPNNIMVSSALDRLVVIMECCNGQTLSRISVPSAVQIITGDYRRIFAGAANGDIYCIDLAIQAAKETAEGVKMATQEFQQSSRMTTLKGHERAVTALFLASDKILVSGAENGEVRIWDLSSRCSTKIITPFASEISSENSGVCPISCIIKNEFFKCEKDRGLFTNKRKVMSNQNDLMYQPFQRFKKSCTEDDLTKFMVAPRVLCNDESLQFWRYPINTCVENHSFRRKYSKSEEKTSQVDNNSDEISRLKSALAEAEQKIERWEKVNNKLAAKLQKAKALKS